MVKKPRKSPASNDWRPLGDLAEAATVAREALVQAMVAAGGTSLEQLTDPAVMAALKLYVDIATKAAPYIHPRLEVVEPPKRIEPGGGSRTKSASPC
jgi:hypothetical protein